MKATATIYTIAQALGVSASTVSRALNNHPSVRAELRAKIDAEADRQGYRRNALAHALVAGRTRTVGLLLPDIRNPFFPELAWAIDRAAGHAGFAVYLRNVVAAVEPERSAIDEMRTRCVDALLVGGGTLHKTNQKRQHLLDIAAERPTIFLNSPPLGEGFGVRTDEAGGIESAVRHLHDLGHRRIALVGGELDLYPTQQRLEGFQRATAALGLSGSDVFLRGWHLEAGSEAAAWLAVRPGVTAVVTMGDLIAFGLVQALRERGVSVPEEVSVVGFDGIGLSRFINPALTTVQMPFAEIGEAAVRLLQQALERESQPREAVLPVVLTLGRSTGPAPRRARAG
ncbi:MAG TPA: LacI family DNA-binding transcriptional regulator [Limnochordia bacterium]|nr:LacI family DNA-binding transcriptional regulator [Limnochordia bacterium]